MPTEIIMHNRPRLGRRKGRRDGLTARQRKFVLEYLKNGGNGAAAIISAGYETKNPAVRANTLLEAPHVKDFLNNRRSILNRRALLTAEDKLERLQHVMNRAIPLHEDLKSKEEVELGLKAMDMSNRMQGHYAADKQVNVNIDSTLEKVRELTQELIKEKDGEAEY